jgi:hypothetical protein
MRIGSNNKNDDNSNINSNIDIKVFDIKLSISMHHYICYDYYHRVDNTINLYISLDLKC